MTPAKFALKFEDMGVTFEIIDGPAKGSKVTGDRNHFIGRQGAEIEINDPKMSSKHAQLLIKPDGSWEMRDNKSTNGIKVEGKKVKSVPLKTGVRIRLGNSVLKVLEITEDEIELSEPSKTAPTVVAPEPTRAPIPAVPEEPKTWEDALEKFAQAAMTKIKNNPKELTAFTPQLKLKFLRGPQVETSWIIGYGPRAVGPSSVDHPIVHAQAPDICFELQPHKGGCRFVTEHTKVVKMNNESKNEHLLRDGDEISIHNILIRVNFI